MFDQVEPNRIQLAFDADAIHRGNKGLNLDHAALDEAVSKLLSVMTLEQKIFEIHGLQPAPIDGLYYAGGDEALGIPPYRMVDGPRGARSGVATAFPVAIARGATFNPALEREVGLAAGLEVSARGGNVILAPTINLLRHPGWGRAQETYSEDPMHMGAMGAAFVSGAQNYVLASPKHFALNNLEMTRFEMSSNVDERTLHELYLPHFKRCVIEAGAASVMSAYNKVNGIYCGENPILLTDILRGDWGFRGFVESDWFLGTRSTGSAIASGMDIEMPSAYRFERDKIDVALADGEITEDELSRNAGRALFMKLAFNLSNQEIPSACVIESEEHVDLARRVAEQSFVLLKNDDHVLPLSPDMKVALIGDLADTENLGDRGSSMVTSSHVTTPLEGMSKYSNALSLRYLPSDSDLSSLGDVDIAVVVAGLTYREEGEFIPTQQQESEGSDLARGGDRADLRLPPAQEELIATAARYAKRVVVLLEGGSAIDVSAWVDDVDGLMMIWYPGREGGHAVANVLFGEVSPSGKLPVSFPQSIDQLMPWDINAMDVEHDLFHGYRYLDQQGLTPLYPFGFGLSYTQFSLEGLQVERAEGDLLFNVTVRNIGDRAGAAVPQLYLSCPDSSVARANKELKGFGRVEMQPGEAVDLVIRVTDEALCYFEPGAGWQLEPTRYQFRLGLSSDDLVLESSWDLAEEGWNPV